MYNNQISNIMELKTINSTELAHMDVEQNIMKQLISKTVISVDSIDYRRLAYFLIETRRAAYKEAHIKRTLKSVLDEFDVEYHTYYNWREKWYLLLPRAIRSLVK